MLLKNYGTKKLKIIYNQKKIMDKYDVLLDYLCESELLSANQEIPGYLGNNINGVTNLDLTNEEEIILSSYFDDGWDESSSSGFEDLPTVDTVDIILDALCEASLMHNTRGKSKDPNYQRNKKLSKSGYNIQHKKAAKDNEDYHKKMASKSSGLEKLKHNYKAGIYNARKRNGSRQSAFGTDKINGIKNALTGGKTSLKKDAKRYQKIKNDSRVKKQAKQLYKN